MNLRHSLAIVLLALSTALTGCVSYSRNELPPVEAWPPKVATPAASESAKQTAFVRFNAVYQFNGEQRAGGTNMSRYEKTLIDSYQQSQRFSRVTSQQLDSDVYAYATLKNNEQGSLVLAYLSGFTMMMIPVTFDNTLTLETVFKDRDGKELGKVVKSETVTTWMQLVLILALPFNASSDGIIQNLAQSSVEEAIKRKLI